MNHSLVSNYEVHNTQLQGRLLIVTRSIWAIFAVFALIIFIISIPIYANLLQTKWVIFAFVILIIFEVGFSIPLALVPSFNLPSSSYFLFYNTCEYFILTLIPLALGMAILRYRLYDIDIIINRTLVYGSLTAILALLYFGLVFLLQTLLNPLAHNSALSIVGSTLVIAALFQPLRARIQRLIDRRFYRSKYNATQTIANFSTTLRNEVELDELKAHLVSVVDETMQPTHISLWLHKKRKGE